MGSNQLIEGIFLVFTGWHPDRTIGNASRYIKGDDRNVSTSADKFVRSCSG